MPYSISSLLPDPPPFSLPTTFKSCMTDRTRVLGDPCSLSGTKYFTLPLSPSRQQDVDQEHFSMAFSLCGGAYQPCRFLLFAVILYGTQNLHIQLKKNFITISCRSLGDVRGPPSRAFQSSPNIFKGDRAIFL